MSQTSTNTQDRITIEHSVEPRSADAENQKTDSNLNSNQQDEQLRELCQDLNSADRDLALQNASPHAAGHLESQLAMRELLLDELIEQLGIWEKEIAGRRETQQQKAHRLEAKQEELDQLAAELARQREQLHEDQIEAERIKAAAEARLETFSLIEKSLNITGQNQEGHRDPARAPKSKAAETKKPAPGSSRQSVALSPPADREEVPKPSPAPQPGPLEESRTSAAQDDLKSDSNLAEGSFSEATGNLSTARFLSPSSKDTADSPSQETPAGPAAKPPASATPNRAEESSDARPNSEHKASEQQNEAGEVDPLVQEYMNSLLGRGKHGQPTSTPSVRSAPPPTPREEKKSSPPQSEPKPTPRKKELSKAAREPKKKPAENSIAAQALSPQKTVDKADISARMRELRDVVNESTGKAVQHHSLERLTEWTQLVGVAVMATLLVGGVMYWFSQPLAQLIVDTAVTWSSNLLVPMIVAVAVVVGVGCLFLWGKRASTQSGVDRNDRSEPAESSPNASGAESTEPNPS